MPRPCGHTEPVTTCRICFWCEDCTDTGRAYRQLWGEPEPDCGPSLARRVWNFAKAAVQHVALGMPTAPPEVQRARLALCLVCEQYRPDNETCKHPQCGCFVRGKTYWAAQACPLGKWGKVG